MDEKIVEEFNERFATIEETLKYIADSQAKSEFISKQAGIKHDKDSTSSGTHYQSFAI
jgi:hypothetical protein